MKKDRNKIFMGNGPFSKYENENRALSDRQTEQFGSVAECLVCQPVGCETGRLAGGLVGWLVP
jgi:hypothetical protein